MHHSNTTDVSNWSVSDQKDFRSSPLCPTLVTILAAPRRGGNGRYKEKSFISFVYTCFPSPLYNWLHFPKRKSFSFIFIHTFLNSLHLSLCLKLMSYYQTLVLSNVVLFRQYWLKNVKEKVERMCKKGQETPTIWCSLRNSFTVLDAPPLDFYVFYFRLIFYVFIIRP